MEQKKVWFITGASQGFGLSLVKQLLSMGQLVAATSRNLNELIKVVGAGGSNFLPLQVDLTDEDSVSKALYITNKTFKRIDVVINAAHRGISGSIEELTDQETRNNFDVNIFGTLNVTRGVMPYMRAQQSGHIINITSINSGVESAVYKAAQLAVTSLSESLAQEVKQLGIHVTVVAPAALRNRLLTSGSLKLSKNFMSDYTGVTDPHTRCLPIDNKQASDQNKAISAVIQVAADQNPPLYLILSDDDCANAMHKNAMFEKEFRMNEELAKAMAYHG